VINIPGSTPAICQKIISIAQSRLPILENPIGSNRSPEIDAMCRRFGVPLASYWCALLDSDVWTDAGAEIPPISNAKAWHPAIAETWRQWALETGRFALTPKLGYATLYGKNGKGPAEHIGVCVVSITPILMDIEGNTSLAGYGRNGEMAGIKPVDRERLIGYVAPFVLPAQAMAA
jgi:hypothetical protein